MTKVAIIGAGFVGSTSAYAILIDGAASEIALIDVNKEKAKGEALDLVHGNLFTARTKVTYGDSYSLCKGAKIMIITAGASQKPGETRLDLTKKNAGILKVIISEIMKHNKDGIIILVSNPLDVLTYLALKWSKFPKERLFGTGTSLDTARFRHHLGEHYDINPTSVHAYIIGEHGDSEFPVWSSANIAGIPLEDFKRYDKKKLNLLFDKTKNAAYEIIHTKGATYYAIGLVVKEIVRTIITDQHKVYPVSTLIDNYYGIENVCLSIPCVLSREGIKEQIKIHLNRKEQVLLKKSADTIKSFIKKV